MIDQGDTTIYNFNVQHKLKHPVAKIEIFSRSFHVRVCTIIYLYNIWETQENDGNVYYITIP
jgi:hypothetical protein